MADGSKRTGRSGESSKGPAASSTPAEGDELTPEGTELAREDLADPPARVEIAPDETDAEELQNPVEADSSPHEADPDDVVIDDEAELDEATEDAREAMSSAPRPVKRNQTVAPVRKAKPTPKRDQGAATARKRTTPTLFVKQSIGELKKVVWPTSSMLRQYFVVVLAFVLFIMFFVAGLDAVFGWLLLKMLG